MHPTVRALLDEFNAAFNDHDIPAMMALFSADCLFENTYPPPDGQRYTGQAAVRAFWEEFFQASPSALIEIEEVVLCGERAFQRWRYTWNDPVSGPGHVRGVDLFRFQDGLIAEKISYVKG